MTTPATRSIRVYRHSFLTRIGHWVNALALALLLMSGLQIFNAHPVLYWGDQSAFGEPLAAFADGFPAWLTLPGYQDLALGRRWHFVAAWLLVGNGMLYLLGSFARGHIQRDLWPTASDLRGTLHTMREHLRLRFPKGEAARRYNVLQQLAYLMVIFGVLPVMLLSGLAMSPRIDAQLPFLVTLFDGRQSARTLHFLGMGALVMFFCVHVLMVAAAGFWNELRSMFTGRFVIRLDDES